MIIFPNSKINLGLYITDKRVDGYHNLETVFYPINLNDALEIVMSNDETTLSTSGIQIPTEQENKLCLKAYKLLKEKYKLSPIKIHLHKHIPIGSGLGGGSSDAIHTIILLDKLFKLNLSTDDYYSYARQLGSDCSFFVDNKPKLAFEKGDVFKDIKLSLKGWHLLLIIPPVSVSTAEAYGMVKPKKSTKPLKNIISLPVELWRNELINDFEETVFKKYPIIAEIKENLYRVGAVYASMSGSGSAVYGLFKQKPHIENMKDCFTWSSVCNI